MNLFTLAASQWTFGINDPSFIAWLIFFVYFVTAILCWRAPAHSASEAARADRPIRKRTGELPDKDAGARALWAFLALCLILLGLNKQLDLHQLLFDRIRELNSEQVNSRWILGGIIAAAGLLAGSATLLLIKLLRGSEGRLRWAYLTLFGLLGFQVLRFLPGPISGLMVIHLFGEEEGLLHVHFIEVLELGCLIAIGLLARGNRTSSPPRPVLGERGLGGEGQRR